jgi:hypothetical protein
MPTDPVRQLPGYLPLASPIAPSGATFRLPEDEEDEWPAGGLDPDPEATEIIVERPPAK